MNRKFCLSRFPDCFIDLAIVSGEYPFISESLEKLGVHTISTDADSRLPAPVRFHPDMQCCPLKETLFVFRSGSLKEKLIAIGAPVEETHCEPRGCYPGDVICNALFVDPFLIGNIHFLDSAILKTAERLKLKKLPVRQGYAACSVAFVDKTSAITADPGIAEALTQKGFTVLQIRPGYISLPGYEYGFIGGCCGLLSPNMLAFTGKLLSHPDGQAMLDFIRPKGITVVELSSNSLLDIGGIIPLRLTEKA